MANVNALLSNSYLEMKRNLLNYEKLLKKCRKLYAVYCIRIVGVENISLEFDYTLEPKQLTSYY